MITILLVTAGVMMLVGTMYACLVVGSRMDDQLTDLYQRGWEEQNNDGRNEEDEA